MSEHMGLDAAEKATLKRQTTEHGKQNANGDGHGEATTAHPLLQLQRQIGNAQIARMLAQREAGPDEEEVQASHDHSMAQREGAPEEEEVQASHDTEQVGLEGGAVGPDTTQRIQAARGGGSALDTGTRSSMESNFGTSFEDVRVHHNSESDTLNRRLTAKAFTTGSDIFLRSDSSPSDSRLLAHELTHVVQQRSMGGSGSGMSVGAAGDPHEHHADSMAESVTSQAPVAASHDQSMAQREGAPEEEEMQALHDPSMAQREAAPDEEEAVQASHDGSLAQREGAPEEEEVQASHDTAQREAAADEEPA
jgi:hypothetical protein